MMPSAGRFATLTAGMPSQRPAVSTANPPKPPKRAASAATMGGKKVTGRKRHIAVDTQGNLLAVVVHAANLSDRDGLGRWWLYGPHQRHCCGLRCDPGGRQQTAGSAHLCSLTSSLGG